MLTSVPAREPQLRFDLIVGVVRNVIKANGVYLGRKDARPNRFPGARMTARLSEFARHSLSDIHTKGNSRQIVRIKMVLRLDIPARQMRAVVNGFFIGPKQNSSVTMPRKWSDAEEK